MAKPIGHGTGTATRPAAGLVPGRSAARTAQPLGQAALPTYALYGEQGVREATDWLHVESIAARSRLHDWEIRPHRHELLFQVLHLRQGRAEAWLESGRVLLDGPAVCWLPALVPHGFRFDPAVDGVVVTVLETHLRRLLADHPALAQVLLGGVAHRWLGPDGSAAQAVDAAMRELLAEAAASAPWRDLALDAALLRVAVVLARLGASEASGPDRGVAGAQGARAPRHVQRYRALVDARFREHPTLTTLATDLGITPTQLNRACHQVLGHSAQGVLHARLLLEAQRELAYTTLGVQQIALGLGFADAAYFSRFFRRQCGCTPTAWRARVGR